jgi:methionyl-tRNA synthetase
VSDDMGEHTALRYDGSRATGRWEPSQLEAGRTLQQPQPLFKKLEIKIVEEERARMGQPRA